IPERISNKISLAFSPDSQFLAATGAGQDFSDACHTTYVWNLRTGEVVFKIESADAWWGSCAADVAWSPSGKTLAIAYGQGKLNLAWPGYRVDGPSSVALYNAVTGQRYALLVGHATSVEAVAFSPDGWLLASASLDGTVILWDMKLVGEK